MKVFIFVLIVLSVLILLTFGFFFFEIRNRYDRKYFKRSVYKKLYYLADEEDYLLLNNVKLDLDLDSEPSVFDHILFGEKYIYLICDVYLEGSLTGTYEDTYLIFKDKRLKQRKMTNFLNVQRLKVESFCHKFGIDTSNDNFVFNVVCYNFALHPTKSLRKKEYGEWFLPSKDLIKTIKISEKDDIKSISKEKSLDLFNNLKEYSDRLKSHQTPKYD